MSLRVLLCGRVVPLCVYVWWMGVVGSWKSGVCQENLWVRSCNSWVYNLDSTRTRSIFSSHSWMLFYGTADKSMPNANASSYSGLR